MSKFLSVYSKLTASIVSVNAFVAFVFTNAENKETCLENGNKVRSIENKDMLKARLKSAFYFGMFGFCWPVTYPATLYFDNIDFQVCAKKYSQKEDEIRTYKDKFRFEINGFNGFDCISKILSDTPKKEKQRDD